MGINTNNNLALQAGQEMKLDLLTKQKNNEQSFQIYLSKEITKMQAMVNSGDVYLIIDCLLRMAFQFSIPIPSYFTTVLYIESEESRIDFLAYFVFGLSLSCDSN